MKRLTDTKKWDVWFRKLTPSHKAMFDYLYDHCGSAGAWDRDDEIAQMYVNDPKLSLEEFLKAANEGKERIKVLRNGKVWFLVDFVKVQCPAGLKRLTSTGHPNRVHGPIYAELQKYGIPFESYELIEIRASTEPPERLLNIDKDINIENDKDKEEEGEFDALDAFKAAFKLYPNKIREGFAQSHFFALNWNMERFTRFQTAQAKYQIHLSLNDWRQPMEFTRFLAEWEQWENRVETKKEKKYASDDDRRLAAIKGK